MKYTHEPTMEHRHGAFTLVEMLVVIAIIAILAGILIPVVGRAKTKAKVAAARVEMAGLELAIKTYHNDYSRWPVPKNYPRNVWDDVSYGWEDSSLKLNNNDLMAILMAVDTPAIPNPPLPTLPLWWGNRPPATGVTGEPIFKPAGANSAHGRNPKKNRYILAERN